MVGGKEQGPGKCWQILWGVSLSVGRTGRRRMACFCVAGTLSFRSFIPHPVITMATDGETKAGRTEVVLPQVTWLVNVRAGIPAAVQDLSLIWVTSAASRPPRWPAAESVRRGLGPWVGDPVCTVPAPHSTGHVPRSSLSSLCSPCLAQRPPGGPGSGVLARPWPEG